jgi:CrcB protein
MIRMMLLAGCGGFVGTALRFLTGKLCAHYYVGGFPLGTFVVNVVGSLLIGILFGLAEGRGLLSPSASAVLITGFCGGFTTFSTFADDIFLLLQKGNFGLFAAYVSLSLVVGVLMVWAGRCMVR